MGCGPAARKDAAPGLVSRSTGSLPALPVRSGSVGKLSSPCPLPAVVPQPLHSHQSDIHIGSPEKERCLWGFMQGLYLLCEVLRWLFFWRGCGGSVAIGGWFGLRTGWSFDVWGWPGLNGPGVFFGSGAVLVLRTAFVSP